MTSSPPRPPRCDLDTCIVSGIARKHLKPLEVKALEELVKLRTAGAIEFVTSDVAKMEISKIPAQYRATHEAIEAIYNSLATVPSSVPVTALGPLGLPMASPHLRRLRALEKLLPDMPDARHVVAARRDGLEYFVTTDEKTILKYRDVLREQFGVTAVLPSELLRMVTKACPARGG